MSTVRHLVVRRFATLSLMGLFRHEFGNRLHRSALARVFTGVVSFAAVVSGLSGCQAVQSSAASVAQVRIIDASPDAGGVDIYASSTAIAYNLGFGTVSTYVPVSPSTYTFAANASGTKSALASTRAGVAASKQYTLFISNAAASLQAQLLQDQAQAAPSGQISLRFLDAALSTGALDIYLVPSGSALNKVNPIQTGVAFGANSGYLNVPSGTYTLYLLTGGTVVSSSTVPVYVGAATSYAGGSARTVVILDNQIVTSPPVQVITANDYDAATATQ